MKLSDLITSAIKAYAAQQENRSFYLYDTSVMQAKIAHLKTLMPESVQIYYAMKANPHKAFLKTTRESGLAGIEIASMGEGEKALAAGFTADQILFTGPGKSPDELQWSAQNGIHAVHIESLTEAHRLEAICTTQNKRQDILVRVNPNFQIHGAQTSFSGDPCKFGIDENIFREVLPQILAMPHLNFRGLHVYAASGVLKTDDLLENCRRVFTLAQEIESAHDNAHCDVIDFGGGFGIDYLETGDDFSPENYASGLKDLIATYGFEDRTFVLELGRYLTADSGWYCTEILDIKTSLGKKQVICAGGIHHFRRPVALNINHPLVMIPMNRPTVFDGQESVAGEEVFIGGPLCNGADRLAPKDIYIERAAIGDIAVFGLAGAYGLTMSHMEFLSHPHPAEITI